MTKMPLLSELRANLTFLGRRGTVGSASQSEAMTVAVGFSPREVSAKTVRRGATLEGLDWLFGSSVAPRRAPFPQHYSVGSSPRLPSRSRSATSQKVRYAPRAGAWDHFPVKPVFAKQATAR